MTTQKRTKLTASRTEIERTRFSGVGRASRSTAWWAAGSGTNGGGSPVLLRQALGNRGVGAVRIAFQVRLGDAPSTGAVAGPLQRLHQPATGLACERTGRLFLKILLKPAGGLSVGAPLIEMRSRQ